MKKIDRIEKLLNILIYSDKFQTASSLAKAFTVSNKTIYNDLKTITDILLKYDLKLLLKPKSGIKIIGNKENKNNLLNNFRFEISSFNIDRTKRQFEILSLLLLSNNHIYLDDLCQKYYISRSMIEKDLNDCEKWLIKHKLTLIKNEYGIKISGQETDIRNALSTLANLINENNLSVDKLFKYPLNNHYYQIKNIVSNWDCQFRVNLNSVNLDNLVFHISVMCYRIIQNKTLKDQCNELKNQLNSDYIPQLNQLFHDLENTLQLKIPQTEKDFIFLHIIGLLFNNKDFLNNDFYEKLHVVATTITEEFITNIEKIIPLNLGNNNEFKQSLIIHLLPTIYRLQLGLNLYNPLLHTIKEEYSNVYSLATIINTSFLKYLNIKANDEEIGFITLHLSLAIEKIKETITAAIICQANNSIINFLLTNLKKNFPYIKFVITNISQLNTIENLDFILSTEPIDTAIPLLLISPILSKVDISNIHQMISNQTYKSKPLFTKNTILIEKSSLTKIEILTKLYQCLKFENAVSEQFINGVIKREKMGNTEIGNGVVLTHGFSDDVLKTQIAFLKLNHPILWNSELITFVVMLAIDKHDAKNVIQMNWLYKLLVDKKQIETINKCNSETDLFVLISKAISNQK